MQENVLSTEQKRRLCRVHTKVFRPLVSETTNGNDETLPSAVRIKECQSPAFPPPLPRAPVSSHLSMNTNQMTFSNRLFPTQHLANAHLISEIIPLIPQAISNQSDTWRSHCCDCYVLLRVSALMQFSVIFFG